MGGIFINYRRNETAGEARALFNELSEHLGPGSVFVDVDTIALGRDFRQVLQERLASVEVMLTLIGREWTHADASGRRRLDEPNDFVRGEIRAALERNIAVTPVLVQGAQMPGEAELPLDIRDLAYRNGFELSHARWSSDVHELLKRLGFESRLAPEPTHSHPEPVHDEAPEREPSPARRAPSPPTAAAAVTGKHRRKLWPLWSAAGVAIVVGIGVYEIARDAEEQGVRQQLVTLEADKRRAQADADRAAAQAQAASVVAAQAEAERDRVERDAQERAAAQVAAAQQAMQAELARQRAATEQAARDQARQQQAARQESERQRAALQQQQQQQVAQRQQPLRLPPPAAIRMPDASMDQRMADVRQGKFSGSLMISLGDYAILRRLAPDELTTAAVSSACTRWSQQVAPSDVPSFRKACFEATLYGKRYGMRAGTRPATTQWASFCSDRARGLTSDIDHLIFLGACPKFR